MFDDMELPIRRRDSIMSKILARVLIVEETGCWLWQGPTSGDGRGGGYGRMSLDGQTVAVHIVSYTHFYGYVPSKKQVDHICRNRLCCNPLHLELVTHLQNQKRRAKAQKGNHERKSEVSLQATARGVRRGSSKSKAAW